jgi:hypothetical protein
MGDGIVSEAMEDMSGAPLYGPIRLVGLLVPGRPAVLLKHQLCVEEVPVLQFVAGRPFLPRLGLRAPVLIEESVRLAPERDRSAPKHLVEAIDLGQGLRPRLG